MVDVDLVRALRHAVARREPKVLDELVHQVLAVVRRREAAVRRDVQQVEEAPQVDGVLRPLQRRAREGAHVEDRRHAVTRDEVLLVVPVVAVADLRRAEERRRVGDVREELRRSCAPPNRAEWARGVRKTRS